MTEKHTQLRLLPTVAEFRRQRQAAAERAALPAIRCWQCKATYAPDLVSVHPDTGMDICGKCHDAHPEFYDKWLARRIATMEAE